MKLSILTASYGDQSNKFIELCYRSLKAQTFQDFEIIHVSSGDFVPDVPGDNRTKHVHHVHRMHYPAAIAHAYDLSDKSSEFIFMLNDDVIMHKDCLQSMINFLSLSQDTILNPASECCNGRAYMAPLGFFDQKGNQHYYTKNHYSYEEMAQNAESIIERSFVNTPIYIPTAQVWFFATMMKRSVWEKVGGIDRQFRTGFDDQDMSLRARKMGINVGIFMGASVFHFSGATSDGHLSDEDRAFNLQYFREKNGL